VPGQVFPPSPDVITFPLPWTRLTERVFFDRLPAADPSHSQTVTFPFSPPPRSRLALSCRRLVLGISFSFFLPRAALQVEIARFVIPTMRKDPFSHCLLSPRPLPKGANIEQRPFSLTMDAIIADLAQTNQPLFKPHTRPCPFPSSPFRAPLPALPPLRRSR